MDFAQEILFGLDFSVETDEMELWRGMALWIDAIVTMAELGTNRVSEFRVEV